VACGGCCAPTTAAPNTKTKADPKTNPRMGSSKHAIGR